MKKVLTSVIAIGCLAAAGSVYAGLGAGTGVNGSLHDMTYYGTSVNIDKMGRVCVYCHAPHHALTNNGATSPNTIQYPLWNHQLSTANFVPYTWATPDNANAPGSSIDVLAGPSRLCMSCHDGSVAVDEHGNWTNIGGTTTNNGTMSQSGKLYLNGFDSNRANLTNDLSNTHPIGFDYNQVATYRNAKSTNGTGTKVGGKFVDGTEIVVSTKQYADSINTDVPDGTYNVVTRAQGGKTIAENLYNGNIMTCATCHEVHNKENVVQDTYVDNSHDTYNRTRPNYFLYAKETNSLICLSCHVK